MGPIGAENRSGHEDVTTLLPSSMFHLVASSLGPVSSLCFVCHFRPLIKGAGSDMSPQTRTGKALLQPSGPTCPQTEVSSVPAEA